MGHRVLEIHVTPLAKYITKTASKAAFLIPGNCWLGKTMLKLDETSMKIHMDETK